ncbi:L-lactate MFS transporter [Microbacterium dextranolyticum]|uniref:MFS transporter n=1 Tax=Microbacterium dextranolyticum TaxID=36806 RepID=A0A9W6HNQ7_9MICO|nr:MFS transporter [Microbacterium dextranolyticum]MBM7464065.1 OFA family oxalate/formate antiporter-like MFS transporter [Microbacterium dextranolyticum]GLJ96606.1 MFS transporter [Microbacterium dextranolyticum]
MSSVSRPNNPARWGVLGAAFIVLFFVSSIALFSVFLNPLAQKNDWTPVDVTLSFSIFQTVMAVTGIFSGRISDRVGPRAVLLLGGLLFGIGWFFTGLVTALPMLYLVHGVIAGMGNGLVYNPALTTAQRWFPDMRGKASGLLLGGAAIGPALLAPAANALLGAMGLTGALMTLGVVFWIAISLGGLFVRPVPVGYAPQGAPAAATADGGVDWRGMLSSGRFYLMLALFAAAATGGTMLVGAVSAIAQKQIGDVGTMAAAAFGALMVSVSTIANFAGRLSFGALYDRIGPYRSLLIMLSGTLAAMLLLTIATAPALFVVCIVMLGFTFGALLVIYPPLTGETFGTKNLGVNYGIMFLGYAIGAWIGPRLATSLFSDETGYRNAFFAASAICAVGLVLVFVLKATASRTRGTASVVPAPSASVGVE